MNDNPLEDQDNDYSDHGQPGQAGQPGHESTAGAGGQGGRGGTGQRGHAGTPGERGETGTTGERGLPGEAGQRGQTGTTGTTGETGRSGATGQRGQTGLAGLPGTTLDLETLATIASLDAETIGVLAALTPETLDVLRSLKDSMDDQKQVLAQIRKVSRTVGWNRIVIIALCVLFILGGLLFWNQRVNDARQTNATCAAVNENRQFNRTVYLLEAETAEEVAARPTVLSDITKLPGYEELDPATRKFRIALTKEENASVMQNAQDNRQEAKVDRATYTDYVEQFPLQDCG